MRKYFVFAFNRNIYRAHWDNPKTNLKGIAYIPSSKDDIIVVKWESFKASNLSIALEEDSTKFKSKWYANFPSEDSSDKLILYVAINKIYVTEIIYSQLDQIKKNYSYPNLKKVTIKAFDEFITEKDIINAIQYIPKKLYIKLIWDENSKFLKSSLFWSLVNKFKRVVIQYRKNFPYEVNCEDQALNIWDARNIMIKEYVDNSRLWKKVLQMMKYCKTNLNSI